MISPKLILGADFLCNMERIFTYKDIKRVGLAWNQPVNAWNRSKPPINRYRTAGIGLMSGFELSSINMLVEPN